MDKVISTKVYRFRPGSLQYMTYKGIARQASADQDKYLEALADEVATGDVLTGRVTAVKQRNVLVPVAEATKEMVQIFRKAANYFSIDALYQKRMGYVKSGGLN